MALLHRVGSPWAVSGCPSSTLAEELPLQGEFSSEVVPSPTLVT